MKLQDFLFVISTVIAVTAAARLPTESDPGFWAFPYFPQSEPAAMLQQVECPGDACGRVEKSVGVESLEAGQIVEVRYTTPTGGRVIVKLRAPNGDIILNAAARIDWKGHRNQFILNSYINGKWLPTRQEADGFPFTSPPEPTEVTLRIVVRDTDFVVKANGVNLANYAFLESLTPDRVTKVACILDDEDAPIKGEVEYIKVSF